MKSPKLTLILNPTSALDGKVKGALRFTTPYPSFEAMDSADGDNVYEVVVRISDGNESKTKTVTVTVENVEEAGTVSLSQRTPQQGIPVTASLSDKDGKHNGHRVAVVQERCQDWDGLPYGHAGITDDVTIQDD